jgi:hypothetical protein
MQSFDPSLFHFVCDGVLAISGESVNAGPHEKVGAQIVRCTKRFVNVAFPIANVNATHWFTEQRR